MSLPGTRHAGIADLIGNGTRRPVTVDDYTIDGSTRIAATLDDILAVNRAILKAIQATTATIVGTAETCRRLNIGPDQLRSFVAAGRIEPIPHLRGRGGGFCYHVSEIARCADELAKRPRR